jgi:hypothetical protein
VKSQTQTQERASIVSCEVDASGPKGAQLVAVVKLGEGQYRYRIESSRSWRCLDEGEISAEKQRLIDSALWGYLRDFTGEIDARNLPRTTSIPPT